MIRQKLVNIGYSVCSSCAFYLEKGNNGYACRFPKDSEKECTPHTDNEHWLNYKIYRNYEANNKK